MVCFATTEITGVVKDQASGQTLPYATITFKDKNFGIISDETGAFRLEIDKVSKQDTVQISFVGYKTLLKTTKELKANGECLLTPIEFEINEVEVRPVDVEVILKEAYDRFYDNHVHRDIATKGYYREQFFEGKECVRFGESVFDTKYYQIKEKDMVSVVPYLARSIEDSAFLRKFNHIFNVRKEVIPFGIDQYYKNGMVEGYKVDKYYEYIGAFFFGNGKDGFTIDYKLSDNYEFKGRENYFIKFKINRKKFHIANGHFLIDKENYGIAAFEIKMVEQEDLTKRILSAKIRLILKLLGYGVDIQNFESKIDNRFIDGKWYIGNGIQILKGGIAKRGDWIYGKLVSEFYTFYHESIDTVEQKTDIKDLRTNDFNTSYWKGHPHVPIQPRQQEYIDKIIAKNANFSGEVMTTAVILRKARQERKKKRKKGKESTD